MRCRIYIQIFIIIFDLIRLFWPISDHKSTRFFCEYLSLSCIQLNLLSLFSLVYYFFCRFDVLEYFIYCGQINAYQFFLQSPQIINSNNKKNNNKVLERITLRIVLIDQVRKREKWLRPYEIINKGINWK